MFNRSLILAGMLVASLVGPYVLLNDQLANAARGSWTRVLGDAKEKTDKAVVDDAAAGITPLATPSATAVPIEQAFRFDLTPQWITSRWPRFSNVLGAKDQLGMRVAWVSGTRADDVAGSLTYYFDQHHQLQRITFTGLTSDARRLLTAVVTPNGLKSQPTTDAAHYIAGDSEKPTSKVIVRHLPLTGPSAQTARAEVSVDLARADVMNWRQKAEREPEVKLLPSGYRRW